MASELDKLQKVGIGTATTLSAPGKAAAATSITVGSTANFPTTTGITFAIRVVDGNGELVAGTYTEWVGTVTSGTTLAMNAVPVYGSDQVYTAGSTTQVYMPLSSYSYNKMIDGLLAEHEQLDGKHKTTLITARTEDTTPDVGADFLLSYDTSAAALKKVKPSNLGLATGWISGQLPAVSSVTENGNRSADITFASTVASILTPGMRIRTSRTVAAPTYMGGAFNGTNHYFTKVTPTSTLSTVADNWTLELHHTPTSYAAQEMLMGRFDATLANGFAIGKLSTGQIFAQVCNAGAGNFKQFATYQSLPLNKESFISVSWATGTVVFYVDGIIWPSVLSGSGGTAPNTAGTGGDFSIGRAGAYNGQYTTGYSSGGGAFNAVLTQATIKSHKGQALTGSETNCIGAWSLNNTGVNQQAAGTNDLTATGGVGYTSGRSPYTMDANGVAAGTYDWAIVTKVVTTVATVQYPEGCTIPTSGGISTVDYSGSNAFGFPKEEDRWELLYINKSQASHTSPTSAVWYSLTAATVQGSAYLTVPVGKWVLGYDGTFQLNATAGSLNIFATLSTANNSESDPMYTSYAENTSVAIIGSSFYKRRALPSAITTATPYYLNTRITAGSTPSIYNRGDIKPTIIFAIPAYL